MILVPPASSKSTQDGPKPGQDGLRSTQDGSKTVLNSVSLTEGTSKGSHLDQRGEYTETHTKREPILSSAGRRTQRLFSKTP